MSKRFNLKFTIPSFQICRSKDLSSFPGNPIVPAIYRLSPVNPKARDTCYASILPTPPPPSTPEDRYNNNKVSSKRVSSSHGCKMCRHHEEDKRVISRGRKSTSSVPSRRGADDVAFRNKLNFQLDDEDEESVSLISCVTSFSDDEADRYSNKPDKKLVTRHRRKISSSSSSVKKVQRLRFHTDSENRKELLAESSSSTEQVKKTKTKTTVVSTRSAVEGKVRESFAVVKRSKDPYQDFKRSMLEMIREMEMSETEDLEQLLQCFLALNSRSYHEVIVRAFMEIWQQMFAWKPASTNNTQTGVTTTATDLEE